MSLPEQDGQDERPKHGARNTSRSNADDQSAFFGPNARRTASTSNRVWSSEDTGRAEGTSGDTDDGYFNREQFNRSQFGASSYRRDAGGDVGRGPRTFRSRGERSERDNRQRPSRSFDDRKRDDGYRSDRNQGYQARPRRDVPSDGTRRTDGPSYGRPRDGRPAGHDRRDRTDARGRDGGVRRQGGAPGPRGRATGAGGPRKGGYAPAKDRGSERRRFDADAAAAGVGRRPQRGRPRQQPLRLPKSTLVKSLVSFQWASRALSLKAILDGRVSINDQTMIHPNVHVKIDNDVLKIDGNVLLRKSAKPITIVFNKPSGLSGSREDGRPSLYTTLANRNGWYMPLGSLTKAASGIVILSNDPVHKRVADSPLVALTSDLLVKVHRNPKKTEVTKLKKALVAAWPADSTILEVSHHAKGSRAGWIKITHRTGKIRDVMSALKSMQLEPLRVMRSRVGPFNIEAIKAGAWYRLSDQDTLALDELAKQRPENDDVSLTTIWEQISAKIFRS